MVPAARHASGGHRYNAAVLAHWPGMPPRLVTLDAAWPDADPDARRSLAAALSRHDVTLLDGLVGAAHPDLVADAVAAGHRVVLLVHLPLADEGGLTSAERRRLDALERDAVHAAWRVVATSRTAASGLIDRHGRADVAVAVPGVDAAPLAGPHDPPHLVAVGTVGPRKNQLTVARALAAVADLPWRATVVGPTPDPGYAAAVLDAASPGRVVLAGELAGRRLEALWASADLLVHCSVAETWGMVVTEALARGIPAIVGAGTGAVEALASGGSVRGLPGAVIDPCDVAGLAGLLRAWLTDETVRSGWRQHAREARPHLPEWSQTAAALAAVLEER